jgi:hypothetical protein
MNRRQRVLLLLLGLTILLFVGVHVYAYVKQRLAPPVFHADTRDEWIEQAVDYLHSFKPRTWSPTPETKTDSEGHLKYYIRDPALIRFADHGWVFIVAHSMHSGWRVGDVVLAIDHRGTVYETEAHPCMAIMISSGSGRSFRTLEEFLETPVEPTQRGRNDKWTVMGARDKPLPMTTHPVLGSEKNPVKCYGPDGERAYLRRLRGPDGAPPTFFRLGSYGVGPYGNIIDGYKVKTSEAEIMVFMDMYHPDYVETNPVAGFGLVEE